MGARVDTRFSRGGMANADHWLTEEQRRTRVGRRGERQLVRREMRVAAGVSDAKARTMAEERAIADVRANEKIQSRIVKRQMSESWLVRQDD